jgi:AraC-like DNA-binding protein
MQCASGFGPPQDFKLRMRGGRRHGSVKVEIAEPLLTELGIASQIKVGFAEGAPVIRRSGRFIFLRKLSSVLALMARHVIHCPMSSTARRVFIEGKSLEIIAHEMDIISSAAERNTYTDSADHERLQEARSILESEFADPPGLLELARRVGLNDFKLKLGFRRLFGTTVFEYVRSLRMERARYLLERGNMSVTEAALEAGYSSLGNFAAAFKRRFGILPSECRSGRRKRFYP